MRKRIPPLSLLKTSLVAKVRFNPEITSIEKDTTTTFIVNARNTIGTGRERFSAHTVFRKFTSDIIKKHTLFTR